jgi:hypothetical protein
VVVCGVHGHAQPRDLNSGRTLLGCGAFSKYVVYEDWLKRVRALENDASWTPPTELDQAADVTLTKAGELGLPGDEESSDDGQEHGARGQHPRRLLAYRAPCQSNGRAQPFTAACTYSTESTHFVGNPLYVAAQAQCEGWAGGGRGRCWHASEHGTRGHATVRACHRTGMPPYGHAGRGHETGPEAEARLGTARGTGGAPGPFLTDPRVLPAAFYTRFQHSSASGLALPARRSVQ